MGGYKMKTTFNKKGIDITVELKGTTLTALAKDVRNHTW